MNNPLLASDFIKAASRPTTGRCRRMAAIILWLLIALLPYFLAVNAPVAHLASRMGLIGAVLLVTRLAEMKLWRWLRLLGITTLFGLSLIVYTQTGSDGAAWLLVISWFSLNLLLGRQIVRPIGYHRLLDKLWIIGGWLSLAALTGLGLSLANALYLNFAEEEFFTLITGLYFSLIWVLLALGYHLAYANPASFLLPILRQKGVLFAVMAGGIIVAVYASYQLLYFYQRSFFPATAPTYPGLSEQTPFLCESLSESGETVMGEQIKAQLIDVLEAMPDKNTLILGSLALQTGETAYARNFRDHLLHEAKQGLYTSPAHSIKGVQFEVALRAQQVALIKEAFPHLFSAEEWAILKAWFARINHRVMTVEWVDWLYAGAYGKRPAGPYENQEVGVGLLAVLMKTDLAAPELREANQEAIAAMAQGWRDLFRNTDDAYFYQGAWLSNSWWLYEYWQVQGQATPTMAANMQLAFDWLLAQALPDGEALSYNLHLSPSLAEYYLAGAALTNDPHLIWLAGKSLARLSERDEQWLSGFTLSNFEIRDGTPPAIGSCLLFGNSGVPTRKGPLAPDKVVLRDGWSDRSNYALVNLRFSGWHRYKATNTLPLLYQAGPLVSEKWTSETLPWLPEGRVDFRDKRVPRENLNGLLLSKSGLPRVLWVLSGLGSQWMQNPPAYADVEQFFTTDIIDGAKTVLPNWQGWRHERTIYLINERGILVIDQAATDEASSRASVVWHVNGSGQPTVNGLRLDSDQRPARLVWSEQTEGTIRVIPEQPSHVFLRDPDWEVLYTSPDANRLDLATAFLTGDHADSRLTLTFTDDSRGLNAILENERERLSLLHNGSGQVLDNGYLTTDGTMLLQIEDKTQPQMTLCYAGGQTIGVKFSFPPTNVLFEGADSIPPEFRWQFDGQWLTVHFVEQPKAGCLVVT